MTWENYRGLYVADLKYSRHYYPCGIGMLEKLWWRFMPGVIIRVQWPQESMVVVTLGDPRWSGMGPVYEEYYSCDPNDHYRPWLEEHIGQQHWDWDWQWAQTSYLPGRYGARVQHDSVLIRVRKKHQEKAAEMKLLLG